jgi:hypothetical protein
MCRLAVFMLVIVAIGTGRAFAASKPPTWVAAVQRGRRRDEEGRK